MSYPPMPTRRAPPVRYADIEYGDTLQSIALRELGTAAQWVDLVILNGLRPPYIAEQAGLGVLAYGDVIQLPAGVSTISAEISPADLYGTDVRVASDGALPVEDGDFALVSGVPNLRAALARRVTVDKRELAFHPEYGCYVRRLLGRSNGPTAGQLAAFYIKSSVLEDSRVRAVPTCLASVLGDQISAVADALPVTGKPVEVKVLF